MQSGAVALGAIATVAALGLWLQKELNAKGGDVRDKTPVAKLNRGVKSVQRKLDREVLWEDVATDDVLYNRDSVRTDENSEARIHFDDGTQLELSENSLVVLDRNEDKIGIQFLKGNVFARGGGGRGGAVEIQTSGGRVRVGGPGAGGQGALALSTLRGGLEVTVAEGSAQLQTAQGTAALGVNERGKFGAGGISKQQLALVAKAPAPNSRMVAKDGRAPLTFEWTGRDGAKVPAQLQIATDGEFATLVERRDGVGQQTVSLAPGRYFWRAVTLERGAVKDTSEEREFHVFAHAPVRLESPRAGAEAAYFREKPAARFVWSVAGGGEGTDRLELSADRNFTAVLKPSAVLRAPAGARGDSRREARFAALVPGSYFWRVVTRYDDAAGTEIASEARAFKLTQLDHLPAPELLEPAPGATVGLSARQPHVRFEWSPVSEAAAYRLKVAVDPAMQSVILSEWLVSPEWEGELKASGALYWTVESAAGRAPTAEDSLPAKTARFQLARSGGFRLLAPKPGERIQYLGERPPIAFGWEPRGGAARYEVQVAADERFQALVFEGSVAADEAKAPELRTPKVAEGDRYWRVRAFDAQDRVIGLSESGRFALAEFPVLVAPEKKSPASQARIGADPVPKISFEWQPVEKAARYEFTLWKQGASGKLEPLLTEEVEKPFFEHEIQEGGYQWDVRAIDAAKRRGLAGKARTLEVRQSDRLAAPALVDPVYGARIEGTVPEKVPLRWEAVPGAKGYEVLLTRLEKDGKKTVVRQQTTEATTLVIPESILTGQYTWQVAALGVAPGAKSAAPRPGEAATSQFAVRWIGVMPAPFKVQVKMENDDTPAPRRPAALAPPPAGEPAPAPVPVKAKPKVSRAPVTRFKIE